MAGSGGGYGKTRRNLAEAQAVIKELLRRAHDPRQAEYSVGGVTFNVQQQTLISDLPDEACKIDPRLESRAFGHIPIIRHMAKELLKEHPRFLFSENSQTACSCSAEIVPKTKME